MKTSDEIRDNALIAAAMKAIRKSRRMRTSEIARALGMPLRSYEHFEAGRGKLSYERIARFAEVTNSDPLAIMAAIPFRSADFALHCADNKLMTIVMIAMCELHEELGEDLTYLEPRTIIGAMTRVSKDMIEHVRKRDVFAENWLEERSNKVARASPVTQPSWPQRIAESDT